MSFGLNNDTLNLSPGLKMFDDFSKAQMDAEKIKGTKNLGADDKNKSIGENAIAQFTNDGVIRSVAKDEKGNFDKVYYTGRGKDLKSANNDTRTKFLNAVIGHYGSYQAIPKKVLSALKIGKFSLDSAKLREGEYAATSGKPLTARRINAVIKAMKTAETERMLKMSPKEYGSEIALLFFTSDRMRIRNSVAQNIGGFLYAMCDEYNSYDKHSGFDTAITNAKKEIADLLCGYDKDNDRTDDLKGITKDSTLNCHLFGHKKLGQYFNDGNTVFAKLRGVAMKFKNINVAEELEKKCNELVESMLSTLYEIDLKGKDTSDIKNMMKEKELDALVKTIKNSCTSDKCAGKRDVKNALPKRLKALHETIKGNYGGDGTYDKLLKDNFYDDLYAAGNYEDNKQLKTEFLRDWGLS